MLLPFVTSARGAVVLPLDKGSIAYAARIAENSASMKRVETSGLHFMDFTYLAAFAIRAGVMILPLYDKKHFELMGEALSEVRHLDSLPPGVDASAHFRNKVFQAEAKQMLHHFDRFKDDKPEIMVAEDTHAMVLSRLFRVRRQKLTKDSHWYGHAEKLASLTLGHIMEELRGKPKPRKRK